MLFESEWKNSHTNKRERQKYGEREWDSFNKKYLKYAVNEKITR